MKQIPIDKQAHFLAGSTIAFAVAVFFGWEIGLGVAVVAGLAKEIWDKLSGTGECDYWDAVATLLGASFASIVWMLGIGSIIAAPSL